MTFRTVISAAAVVAGIALFAPQAASAQATAKAYGDWSVVGTDQSCMALLMDKPAGQSLMILHSKDGTSGATITSPSSQREAENAKVNVKIAFGSDELSKDLEVIAATFGKNRSYFLDVKADIFAQLLSTTPSFYADKASTRVWNLTMPSQTEEAMGALRTCIANL